MKKILRVLLAMIMLFSMMCTLFVNADTTTIVVTQATMGTDGNVTVRGKVTSGTPGAVTILVTVQNAANGKEALSTMADGSTVAYADQTSPNQSGEFEFKFKPKADLSGSHTTIYVCATGVTIENLFAENLTGNEVKVNYGTTTKPYESVDGVVTISLRPAEKDSVAIATETGYFKQWDIMGIKSTTEGTQKEVTLNNNIKAGILTAKPEFFDDPAHTSVSAAKAQSVILANGKKAIRFLALVGEDYENYANAGFVLSTLGTNPTVEAGYKAHKFNNLYKKIIAEGAELDVTDEAIKNTFETTFTPAGILYANLVIEEGNENTVYYATPYLEDARHNRIYGATKKISLNELTQLDAQ